MTIDDQVDAAELALGLLDGAERAAAMRRCLSDPAFAHEVEQWRDRFATLFTEVPEEAPGAHVGLHAWGVANDNAPRWRWATAAASAAAAVLLGVVVLRTDPAPVVRTVQLPAPTQLVAAMAPTEKAAPFGAVYEPGSGTVRITMVLDVPIGRDAELWWIGADGVPHAIGLLKRGGVSAVAVARADRTRIGSGATLAVSIEPIGGSPKPTPTGPVVATGALTRI